MMASGVVLITGAGGGIGAEAARILVESGANVACVDVDEARVRAVTDRLGDDALPLVADVRDQPSLHAAVEATTRRFGKLDVCIANAGIGTAGCLRHIDSQVFAAHLQINVAGTFNTVQACLADLIDTRGTCSSWLRWPRSWPHPV